MSTLYQRIKWRINQQRHRERRAAERPPRTYSDNPEALYRRARLLGMDIPEYRMAANAVKRERRRARHV